MVAYAVSVARCREILAAGLSVLLAVALLPFGSDRSLAAGVETDAGAASCAVRRCLSVRLSPDLAAALPNGEGVTLAGLAEGLIAAYRGESPAAVRLVAARYDRGRLVRFGVSPKIELDGPADPVVVPDLMATLARAFGPVLERDVTIRAIDAPFLGAAETVNPAAFVGELPTTYIAGAADLPGLVRKADINPDTIHETFPGSIGVVLLLPEDEAMRNAETMALKAAVLRLDYS